VSPPLRRLAALSLLLAALGVLGACTTDRHRAVPAPTSATGPTPAPIIVTPPTTLPIYSQYPLPSRVADNQAKHKQVHVSGCASTGSAATATGTVHNTGGKSARYDITVFFTSPSATAVNYATASVTVAAGASSNFTAARDFAAPTQVLCVLAGVA
jgi:hypothetical protein